MTRANCDKENAQVYANLSVSASLLTIPGLSRHRDWLLCCRCARIGSRNRLVGDETVVDELSMPNRLQ